MNPPNEVTTPWPGFAPSSEPPERWEVDPAVSVLSFTLRHLFVSEIRGQFYRWGGTLFLDRLQPMRSSVEVWVDLDSIDTGAPERDAHGRSAEVLDVAQFPRAVFKSTSVELADEQLVVHGLLHLHGVVHDLDITVMVGGTTIDGHGVPRGRYTVRGSVDRQSFSLHWNQDLDVGGVVVGDRVEIVANVELIKQPDNGAPGKDRR
jgi:polyisoprenoid-binding protein YceI